MEKKTKRLEKMDGGEILDDGLKVGKKDDGDLEIDDDPSEGFVVDESGEYEKELIKDRRVLDPKSEDEDEEEELEYKAPVNNLFIPSTLDMVEKSRGGCFQLPCLVVEKKDEFVFVVPSTKRQHPKVKIFCPPDYRKEVGAGEFFLFVEKTEKNDEKKCRIMKPPTPTKMFDYTGHSETMRLIHGQYKHLFF